MSPLIKRLPRELVHNIGKYLGIFLLMAVSIALTSGFLLAAHSISVIIDDMPETYVIEDGRFTTAFEATDEQLDAVRDAASDSGGIELYKNYSFDASFEKMQGDNARNCTVRTFEHRTQVDLAAYAQGGEPQAADEVAVDRVFATNNDIAMGDTVALNGVEFRVVGIMTLADNQALFQSNSDFTVNTLSFGVAEVSSEGFKALENTGFQPSYIYSYRFNDRDLSVADRVDIEKDMVSALSDAHANVTDLTDVDSNQGIGYAKDDVSGDSAMWTTLLYIIIATGMGLLISTFMKSQIAAIFGTAIITLIPATQFSGMIDPVASLEGPGRWIGQIYPTSHFLTIARGTFSKALNLTDLWASFIPLLIAIPLVLGLSVWLLKKQEG